MKVVAIEYSKLRNELGLVGIAANSTEKVARVKLVRQYDTKKINNIPPAIAAMYKKAKWHRTVIAQETGEYFINMLKRHSLPIHVITTGKKVKDPKLLEKVHTLDRIEMTEFLRKLILNGQLKWPERPSVFTQKLIHEIPFFSKHTTEAGGIDYFAPGSEPDDLVRALMSACFAARNMLEYKDNMVFCGTLGTDRPGQTLQNYISGGDMLDRIMNSDSLF